MNPSCLNQGELKQYEALMLKVGAFYDSLHPQHAQELNAADFSDCSEKLPYFYNMPAESEALEDAAVFDVVKEINEKVKRVTEPNKVQKLAHKDFAILKLNQLIEQEQIFEQLEHFRKKFAEAAKDESANEFYRRNYRSLEEQVAEQTAKLYSKLQNLNILSADQSEKAASYIEMYKQMYERDPKLIDHQSTRDKMVEKLKGLQKAGHIDGEEDSSATDLKKEFYAEEKRMFAEFNEDYPDSIPKIMREFGENLEIELRRHMTEPGIESVLPDNLNWKKIHRAVEIRVNNKMGFAGFHSALMGAQDAEGKPAHKSFIEVKPHGFAEIFELYLHEVFTGHRFRAAVTDALHHEGKLPPEAKFLAIGTNMAASDCGYSNFLMQYLLENDLLSNALRKTLEKYQKVDIEKAVAFLNVRPVSVRLTSLALHNLSIAAHCQGASKESLAEEVENNYLLPPSFIRFILQDPEIAMTNHTIYAIGIEIFKQIYEKYGLAETLKIATNMHGLTGLKEASRILNGTVEVSESDLTKKA